MDLPLLLVTQSLLSIYAEMDIRRVYPEAPKTVQLHDQLSAVFRSSIQEPFIAARKWSEVPSEFFRLAHSSFFYLPEPLVNFDHEDPESEVGKVMEVMISFVDKLKEQYLDTQ